MSESVTSGIIDAGTLKLWCDVHLGKSIGGTPFVSEGRVHFNDDGLHTAVVDAGNVGMHTDIHLDASGFESYESPGAATVGVSFARLVDLIGWVDSDQLIQFDLDMETRKLQLDLGQASQSMRLIDPDSIRREPDTSEIDLPNTVTLTGEQIDTVLTVADLNGETVEVRFDADAETVTFHAEGDTDAADVTFGREDAEDMAAVDDTVSIFSLDYLQAMTDAIPADATVLFQFGDEFPAKWSWAAADGDLSVRSMLAPRIQST